MDECTPEVLEDEFDDWPSPSDEQEGDELEAKSAKPLASFCLAISRPPVASLAGASSSLLCTRTLSCGCLWGLIKSELDCCCWNKAGGWMGKLLPEMGFSEPDVCGGALKEQADWTCSLAT